MSDIERQIIGALLLDNKAIADCTSINSEMFTDSDYSLLFSLYQQAFDNGKIFNLSDANSQIASAKSKIADAIKYHDPGSSVKHDCAVLVQEYKTRQFTRLLDTCEKPNVKDIDTQLGTLINHLQALVTAKKSAIVSMPDIAKNFKSKYFCEREVKQIHCGYPKLDTYIKMEGGDFVIIAARPGIGKSALVTNIANYNALKGLNVGFYNLEMQASQVYERFIAINSNLDIARIRNAKAFLNDEKEQFDSANNALSTMSNLSLICGSKSVPEIRAEAQHMNYDLIIVDYLQLLKPTSRYIGNKAAEVGEISLQLKNLAMDLNIPVIALSQLNRQTAKQKDKEPDLSDLRESGQLEQDASIVIMMWEIDKTKKGVKIEKNRNGVGEKIVMSFDGRHMRFVETEESVEDAKEWQTQEKTPFD